MSREAELQDVIASELSSAGIRFDRQVSTRGLRTDFLVYAPDGRRYVVEAKAWDKYPGFQARAAHQAELIQRISDADGAFVVVEGLQRSDPTRGALTLDRLIPTLESAFEEEAERKRPPGRAAGESRGTVFAAMPFDARYDDVFLVAMTYACHQCNLACTRVDRQEFSRDIVEEIQADIRDSVAVIADLSESNPNVLYEVGFAHALEKPIVHICSTSLTELPFDVAQWNTLPYTQGQTFAFRGRLTRRLRAVLAAA